MNDRPSATLNALLVAAMFAIAFWTVHAAPAAGQAAIHWGPDNQADAWIGGSAIQLVNPIVALVVWFLLCMAPQGFSPSRKSPHTAQQRFSGLFFAQLAIQLALAIHARGLFLS